MFKRKLTILAAVVLALSLLGCQTNPETGRNQLIVLSEGREIALGLEAAPQFLEGNGGPIPSPQIRKYVTDIGTTLSRKCSRPLLPWEFHVLDSSVINAFALPGGKVFISRGLLAKMDNEAQLAGVLGHEIGHVTGKHVNDQMARQMGLGVVMVGLGVAASQSDEDWMKVLGVGVGAGGTLYLLKFSRNDELESDRLGVRYMVESGYNPMGQVQVMQILKEASKERGSQIQLLSTHPLPATRIKKLRAHIEKNYPEQASDEQTGFYADRFNETVIESLATLGPAKHPPTKPSE